MLKRLQDKNWYARKEAAYALGNMGEKLANQSQVIEALLWALKDTESDVKKCAAWALGQMGEKLANRPQVVEALLQALEDEDDEDKDVRQVTKRAFNRMSVALTKYPQVLLVVLQPQRWRNKELLDIHWMIWLEAAIKYYLSEEAAAAQSYWYHYFISTAKSWLAAIIHISVRLPDAAGWIIDQHQLILWSNNESKSRTIPLSSPQQIKLLIDAVTQAYAKYGLPLPDYAAFMGQKLLYPQAKEPPFDQFNQVQFPTPDTFSRSMSTPAQTSQEQSTVMGDGKSSRSQQLRKEEKSLEKELESKTSTHIGAIYNINNANIQHFNSKVSQNIGENNTTKATQSQNFNQSSTTNRSSVMQSSNQRSTNNPLPTPTSNQSRATMPSLPTLPGRPTMPLTLAISAVTTAVSTVKNIYDKVQQDRKEDNEFSLYLEGLNKRMETWGLNEDNLQEEGQSAARFGVHMLEVALEAANNKLNSITIKQEGGVPAELKEVIFGDDNTTGILNQLKEAEKLVGDGMLVDLHRNMTKQRQTPQALESVMEKLVTSFQQLNLTNENEQTKTMNEEYAVHLTTLKEEITEQQTIFFANFFQKQEEQFSSLKAMIDTAKQDEFSQKQIQLENNLLKEGITNKEQIDNELEKLHQRCDEHVKKIYKDMDISRQDAESLEDFIGKIQQAVSECENKIKELTSELNKIPRSEKSKKTEKQTDINASNAKKTTYTNLLNDSIIQDDLETEQNLIKLSNKLNQLGQDNKKDGSSFSDNIFELSQKNTGTGKNTGMKANVNPGANPAGMFNRNKIKMQQENSGSGKNTGIEFNVSSTQPK